MVKVPISAEDDVEPGHDIDFINETEIAPRTPAKTPQDNSKAVHSLAGLKPKTSTSISSYHNKMATDIEGVVVSSAPDEEASQLPCVDSKNEENVTDSCISSETLAHTSNPVTKDEGNCSPEERVTEEIDQQVDVQIPVPVLSNKPTGVQQTLPSTVIAVVQPTTRPNNTNYVRITTNPTKAHNPTQYAPVQPAGQRVTGQQQQQQVQHSTKQNSSNHNHHQQQSQPRRVLSQVAYAPGITIHHCQPGPGGPSPAGPVGNQTMTMTAQPVWPMVSEPVFQFGPGFEPPSRPYCPTHEPQPQEHLVMFHVHPGVSVSFQIGGNQEIVRGKWRILILFLRFWNIF